MGTNADKLEYLLETKNQIKQAIIDKGVDVSNTDTFRSYATKIGEIQGGNDNLPANMSAKYFKFNENSCIGYIGNQEEIIIPKSYSKDIILSAIGANINKSQVISASSELPNRFNFTFITPDESFSRTYTGRTELINNFLNDFQGDVLLKEANRAAIMGGDSTNFLKEVLIPPFILNDILYNSVDNIVVSRKNTFYGEIYNPIDGSDIKVNNILGKDGVENQFGTAKRIIIPSYNQIEIGSYSFYHNENLEETILPNDLETIGKAAFFYCSSLKAIYIPKSVIEIDYGQTNGCISLGTIVVDVENNIYDSRNNCNAVIKKDTNELIWGCKNTVIPNSVTSIGQQAFQGINITGITIPTSIINIGVGAFSSCSLLTTIEIPNSVTSIGYSAFQNCSALTSITIPNSVTSIGDKAFYNCSNLTNIIIPEGVTSIGDSVFYNCSNLTNITIPEGVTSIGSSTFYNCSSLTSITIPEGVTSIGGSAFRNCSALTTMTVLAITPPTLSNISAISTATTKIYIPSGTLSNYQNATNWSNFSDLFEEIPS